VNRRGELDEQQHAGEQNAETARAPSRRTTVDRAADSAHSLPHLQREHGDGRHHPWRPPWSNQARGARTARPWRRR